jgi:hypothetical protein
MASLTLQGRACGKVTAGTTGVESLVGDEDEKESDSGTFDSLVSFFLN